MEDLTKEEEDQLRDGIIYNKKKTLLEDLKALDATLPAIDVEKTPTPTASKRKWLLLLLGFLVGLGIWYFLREPVTDTPPPTSPVTEPVKAPHYVAFNEHFKPYPTLGLVRNDAPRDLRNEALEAYSQKDFATAIQKFETLAETNAGEPKTQADLLNLFFLGIAYVGNEEADKGIAKLKEFQGLAPVLKDQAEWYVALAYLQKGDLTELEKVKNDMTKVSDREKVEGILESLRQ